MQVSWSSKTGPREGRGKGLLVKGREVGRLQGDGQLHPQTLMCASTALQLFCKCQSLPLNRFSNRQYPPLKQPFQPWSPSSTL